jgi:hypothetical protein
MTVVVQLVTVSWSKRSRGGEAARLRAALPEAYPIHRTLFGNRWGLHQVAMYEPAGFQPRERTEVDDVVKNVVGVTLELQHDGLHVQFVWTPDVGVPPRRPRSRPFVLRPGEWGRVVHNGRFVDFDTGGWYYRKQVVNVALLARFAPRIFLGEPLHLTRRLGALR